MFKWLKRKQPGLPSELDLAAHDLCVEVREGSWDAILKQVPNGQPAASVEVISELRRRCPGYSNGDYQRAIAKGMVNSR